MGNHVIALVIPAYRVKAQIIGVLAGIGPEVTHIFVIDDACPEGSGKHVESQTKDKRVKVLFHGVNLGVGGAVVTGYKAALAARADVVVKIDGDGQMDASEIRHLVSPILAGQADYSKGNRFASLTGLEVMPGIRILGNGALSLLTKLSTGYWNVTDPTNGFTAVSRTVLELLPLDMIAKRFFFESDMLFRLSLVRAVVWDVPMKAKYGAEKSNLNVLKAFFEFGWKHCVNYHKRLFYNYYLRDMSAASLELPLGWALMIFGVIFGSVEWAESIGTGIAATAGTVMIPSVSVITGLQLVLAWVNYDVAQVPKHPITKG
jgi:glycosyltransferase involved in cell wall biosynthesis